MTPVTNGRLDALCMAPVVPIVKGWQWLTGQSAANFARLCLFVGLAADLVYQIRFEHDVTWRIVGLVFLPIVTVIWFSVISQWEIIGDHLRRPPGARWIWPPFVVADFMRVISSAGSHKEPADLTAFLWAIGFYLGLYAMTCVGDPPKSVLARLWALTRLRTAPA